MIQLIKENTFLNSHTVCCLFFFFLKRKDIKTPWSYIYIGNQSLIFKKCFIEIFVKMFLVRLFSNLKKKMCKCFLRGRVFCLFLTVLEISSVSWLN